MSASNDCLCICILFLYISVIVINVSAREHLVITKSPNYLKFANNGNKIPVTEIQHLIRSTLGLSINHDLSWKGLPQPNLFKRPKASVLLSLYGFDNTGLELNPLHVVRYPIDNDDASIFTGLVSDEIRSLASETKSVIADFSGDNTVFDVRASSSLFSDLSVDMEEERGRLQLEPELLGASMVALNSSDQADILLLAELSLISDIIHKLKVNASSVVDEAPDFLHFNLGGLQKVVDKYGATSSHVTKVINTLQNFITKLSEELASLYGDDIIVQVAALSGVIDPKAVSRKTRSLLQTEEKKSLEQRINVSDDYDSNYATHANIIIWLCVFLVVSVFSISYALWYIDPGTDSIIYRMTSTRIKKA